MLECDDATCDGSWTLFGELLDLWDGEPESRNAFEREVAALGVVEWEIAVRPEIDRAAGRAMERGAYEAARGMFELDARLSGFDRSADFARTDAYHIAAAHLRDLPPSADPAVAANELMDILDLAPDLVPARDRLARVADVLATRAADRIEAAIAKRDLDAAFRRLDKARQDYRAQRLRAGIRGTRHGRLDAIAFRVYWLAVSNVSDGGLASSERTLAANIALIVLQEHVDPVEHTTDEVRESAVAALDWLSMRIAVHPEHGVLALATEWSALRWRTMGARSGLARQRMAAASLPRIASLGQHLGCWGLVAEASRRSLGLHGRDTATIDREKRRLRQAQDRRAADPRCDERALERLRHSIQSQDYFADILRRIVGSALTEEIVRLGAIEDLLA